MTSKIPGDTSGLLGLIAAAALFAVPAWAQEAEDDNATTPEAAEAPEAAGEEPEEGAAEAPEKGDEAGGEETAADADAESTDEDGPLVVEAEEGSVLDDQTFEGEDDDFTPSEEIPVDQPIPFPVDI